MAILKIIKIIQDDSLEIEGLSHLKGQQVEITIAPVAQSTDPTHPAKSFLRFAGIAADESTLMDALEQDILVNRSQDLQRQIDL